MRIYVFSDTHGDLRAMELVLGKDKPDVVMHLGDYGGDIDNIGIMYPDVEIHAVHGNCDAYKDYGREKYVNVAGKIIYLTHGYQFELDTKMYLSAGGSEMVSHASRGGAEIVLFGHTHVPLISRERGITVMNPGSAAFDKNRSPYPTFGYIEIFENDIVCKILGVELYQ
ncbi:MAG: YfcE family phosphodiesterase [Defluviitaleaceae bacterium]|nr:YfcE family phosphodiesterase [Defluviitaleaceae bacterium]MCL2836635.1 YfcE family phosphodiesterase [Defluviitaleaceae bacterium]